MTDAIEAAAKALAPFINCNDAIHREAARAALLAAGFPPSEEEIRTAFDRSLKNGAPGLSEVMREAIISGAVRNLPPTSAVRQEPENGVCGCIYEDAVQHIERLQAALNDMLDVCHRGTRDSYEIYSACERALAALEPKP